MYVPSSSASAAGSVNVQLPEASGVTAYSTLFTVSVKSPSVFELEPLHEGVVSAVSVVSAIVTVGS